MWAQIAYYKKAVVAFVVSLGGIWAVVAAADWSSKKGLIASIPAIVTAVCVAISKNAEKP